MKSSAIEKYDSYKDSGVEWLGEIPEHWECIRMKRLYKDVSIKNRPNELLSSVTQDRGVIPRDWIDSRMVMPTGNLETFKFIEKEDFAISLRSFEGGLEYCYHDGIISPAYTVLKRRKENLHPLFYKYLFKSISFISELQTSVVGIREGKNISFPELSYSFLPVPPLPEQTAIAQFLDDKTTKIDQAIGIKQQQIALLKERKQILIHKAVTQGLNPNVKLKDSGVAWIGEIPEHWDCVKFKFVIRTKARLGWKGLKASEYVDQSEFGFLSTPNIKNRDINYDEAYFITERRYYESPEIMLQEGDVLLVKDGSTLGITNIVKELPFKCTVNSSIAVLRVVDGINLLPEYLNFYLKSETCQRIIEKKKDGMGVPHLFQSDINNFSIPIFSIVEQKEIAQYIETASAKIETAISLKTQEIEKLQEYKSSLINSVVTGKVRVC